MNNKTQSSTEMEHKLEILYNTPAPDPDFAARLERTLIVKAAARSEQPARTNILDWLRRPAWNYALALIVLLALIIGAAGPANVLAKVKQLFAPGVGFVEPGVTRILTAPVEVRQGDVTLRVESAIAYPKYTEITLTASGLPREKFGPEEGPQSPELYPYLLLPDGTRLNQNSSMSGVGEALQATLNFPPLPENINQATLVLPRLPSLPAGFAPENWSVPLQFQVVGEATSSPLAGFPVTESYTPATNPSAVNGVTAQPLQAGESDQETGIQIQYQWNNPEWKWMNDVQLSLADETGRNYEQHLARLVNREDYQTAPGSQIRTYRFEAFNKQASQANLTIDTINFTFDSQAHITFDPTKNPATGQTWDLSALPGSQINIAGVPVHVLNVTISPSQDEGKNAHYHLDLLVQATPLNGLSLQNLSMSTDPELLISSSCQGLPDNQFQLTIDLPQLPGRPLNLYFPRGEVRVTGPWQFKWELP
jgi:hypothetical protein